MMKQVAGIALSFGLGLLWVAGLSYLGSPWLTWLLLVAAVASFGGASRFAETPRASLTGWGSVAAALFVLWIVGLATGATSWLTWWTLAFAVAFAVMAGVGDLGRKRFWHQAA